MKNRIIITATYLAILTGCVTSTPIYDNQGKQAHSIDCSKGALTWGDCYKKAGELCQASGYDIVNQATDSTGAIVATKGTLSGGFGSTRTLIVRCK